MIYAIFLFLVACEVTWDWYHMEKLNKSPNYAGSNMLRVLLGMVFWAAAPTMKHMTPIEYILLPVFMGVSYWFFFDWWLNLARTWSGNSKPYWYLGENSKLDKWQKANGGAFAWFWIKGLAVIILLILFEVVI